MHDLTNEHWQVLSIFDALQQPLDAATIEALKPSTLSATSEILQALQQAGLLLDDTAGRFILPPGQPPAAAAELAAINTPLQFENITDRIANLDLADGLAFAPRIRLLLAAGHTEEAHQLIRDAVRQALHGDDLEAGLALLYWLHSLLAARLEDSSWESLFLTVILGLCRLKLNLIRRVEDIPHLLQHARTICQRRGDQRSLARIELVLGFQAFVRGDINTALKHLSHGLSEVDNLGDDDIMLESSEFRGMYHYLQGCYIEAAESYEKVVHAADQPNRGAPSFLPVHLNASSALGYCAALLGQFQHAIGVLDSQWRRAERQTWLPWRHRWR